MKNLIYFIMAAILFAGCIPKPTEPETPKKSRFMGKILINSQPLEGAIVQLDEHSVEKVVTGADGAFDIREAARGERTFIIRKDIEGGKVIQREVKVFLTDDEHDMGEVELINAVTLSAPAEVEQNYMRVSWTKSNEPNFAEYRVYRRHSSGIDNKTGQLIFSSNNANDIEFNDRMYRTGMPNFYRVYVVSSNGAMSGSNAESISVPEVNLLPNGDFEQASTHVPDQWLVRTSGEPRFNYFEVTNELVQSGQRSVVVQYNGAMDTPDPVHGSWGGLSHTILTDRWVPGKDYTLAFWVNGQIGNFMVRIVKNGNLEDPITTYTVTNEGGWKEKRINFRIDAETSKIEVWISTRPGQSVNGVVKGFIDNVKIIK
jgi:hypothetical protein